MAAPTFDEDDILALGADVDPAVFAQLQAALKDFQNSVDQTNAKLEQAAETSAKVSENLTKIGSQGTPGIDQAKNSVAGLSDQLSAATEKAEELKRAMPGTLPEQGFINQLPQYAGAGSFVPPQSDIPDVEPPVIPPEPQKTGSMFAVGHALSVAGHSLGAPGLHEAGAFVYMEEGFKRVLPLLNNFNDAIVSNAGPLSGLIGGLTEMGIPMAGLVAVALPAAVGLAALALGIKALNDAAESEGKRLKAEVDAKIDVTTKTADMTSNEAQKELDRLNKLKTEQQDSKTAIFDAIEEEVKTKMPGIATRLGSGLRDAIESGAPAIKERPEFKGLYDELDKLKANSAGTSAEIDILSKMLKDGSFSANDMAANIKASNQASVDRIQRETDLKKQESVDSQMTSEAAKKRLDMLTEEKQRTTEQMAELQPFLNVSEEASKKYAELYLKQKDETQEISDLTNNIIPLIKAREHEAEVVKQTEKDLATIAKAHEDYNKSVADAEVQLSNQVETAKLRETMAEAKARQDTADRIVDIRTNLGEKEQSLATNYQRSIFDDRTKFYNDWAKLDLKAAEDSQDNQIEHIQKLKDIQNRATIDDQ